MKLDALKGFFLGNDFLRPNRFKVLFHTNFAKSNTVRGQIEKVSESDIGSKVVSGAETLFGSDIGRFCESVSFPFYTFNTLTSFVNNKKNNIVESIDYDPVSFTFRVDVGQEILNFIQSWKNAIIDSNQKIGYKDDYKADIEIFLLHLYGEEVTSCTLKNAFLVNVNPIELSLDSRDEISKVSISVNFDSIDYSGDIFDLRSFLKYLS